jgi:hypothetical protein
LITSPRAGYSFAMTKCGEAPASADANRPVLVPEGALTEIWTSPPYRTADRAGVGIAVLADVTVEAKRAIVPPLNQAFALQKVNRQDRGIQRQHDLQHGLKALSPQRSFL